MKKTKDLLTTTSPEIVERSRRIKILGIKKKYFVIRKIPVKGSVLPVLHLHLNLEVRSASVEDKLYPIELEIPVDLNRMVKKLVDHPIRVYCGCPDFKYRIAYYLNQSGNVIRKSALGIALTQEPKREGQVRLCKHLVAALRWVKEKSLNDLLRR